MAAITQDRHVDPSPGLVRGQLLLQVGFFALCQSNGRLAALCPVLIKIFLRFLHRLSAINLNCGNDVEKMGCQLLRESRKENVFGCVDKDIYWRHLI